MYKITGIVRIAICAGLVSGPSKEMAYPDLKSLASCTTKSCRKCNSNETLLELLLTSLFPLLDNLQGQLNDHIYASGLLPGGGGGGTKHTCLGW